MRLADLDPFDYFSRWFAQPLIAPRQRSVEAVIDALNAHPLAQDETAQDYIMPARRYRESPGRFRIYGENQDGWYLFVYEQDAGQPDPPVYFETSLDLEIDHGCAPQQIIDGDHIMACPSFLPVLWFMLGQQAGIRLDNSGKFASGVRGVSWRGSVSTDETFAHPVNEDFPIGFGCCFSLDTICIPQWGAAFLNDDAESSFMQKFAPTVSSRW